MLEVAALQDAAGDGVDDGVAGVDAVEDPLPDALDALGGELVAPAEGVLPGERNLELGTRSRGLLADGRDRARSRGLGARLGVRLVAGVVGLHRVFPPVVYRISAAIEKT